MPSFVNDTDIFDGRLGKIAALIKKLLPAECDNILIAGVGNMDITADARPQNPGLYFCKRPLSADLKRAMGFEGLRSVAGISTGVLGDTGIESAEIIRGVAGEIKPSCVIAVDALAATSAQRLGTTVQISNTGISPGSGGGQSSL